MRDVGSVRGRGFRGPHAAGVAQLKAVRLAVLVRVQAAKGGVPAELVHLGRRSLGGWHGGEVSCLPGARTAAARFHHAPTRPKTAGQRRCAHRRLFLRWGLRVRVGAERASWKASTHQREQRGRSRRIPSRWRRSAAWPRIADAQQRSQGTRLQGRWTFLRASEHKGVDLRAREHVNRRKFKLRNYKKMCGGDLCLAVFGAARACKTAKCGPQFPSPSSFRAHWAPLSVRAALQQLACPPPPLL